MILTPFCFLTTSGGCLPVPSLLRALTTAGAGEATRRGSSRHRSTVSKARSHAYTTGRLLSERLLLQFSLFSSGVVRQPAHDVSNVGMNRENGFTPPICIQTDNAPLIAKARERQDQGVQRGADGYQAVRESIALCFRAPPTRISAGPFPN